MEETEKVQTKAEGSRKVVLTKWMLVVFAIGSIAYLGLLGYKGEVPPDSFFMNFVLGLGLIGGAFAAGNIFEHKSNAQTKVEEFKKEASKEQAKADVEKAKAASAANTEAKTASTI